MKQDKITVELKVRELPLELNQQMRRICYQEGLKMPHLATELIRIGLKNRKPK